MAAAAQPVIVNRLAELVERIQAKDRDRSQPPAKPIDASWQTIERQTLHEWLAVAPPQAVLIDLAAKAVASAGAVFWVGRACWPYAPSLAQADLLGRSVFVDVPKKQRGIRVWAIDLLLRSPAAAAVIADGRGLDMAQSRRLQLAAEAGRSLAMLWRQENEQRELSAAHYRWHVTPQLSPSRHPRWRIECLRRKHNPQRRNDQARMTNDEGGAADSASSFVIRHSDLPGKPHLSNEAAQVRVSDSPPHWLTSSQWHPSQGSHHNNDPPHNPLRTASGQDGLSQIHLVEFRGAEGVVAVPAELADRPRASQTQASTAAGRRIA